MNTCKRCGRKSNQLNDDFKCALCVTSEAGDRKYGR